MSEVRKPKKQKIKIKNGVTEYIKGLKHNRLRVINVSQ